MKTGAWLRGGRGKIAGMVAQKSSDGKGTVLRELVIPKNPQSIDQMATRLAFGTVTQAAALMLPIIGQTFKGMNDEKMNRRRFVALNVPLLKNEAISQSNGGEIKGAFRGKSSTALIPNAYLMSEGNLVLPERLTPTVNTARPAEPEITMPNYGRFTLQVGQSYSPAKIIADIIGMGVNQQLTLVAIATLSVNNAANYIPSAGNSDFVRESGFAACRINLNPDAPEFTFTANTTKEELKTAMLTGFNVEKTTAAFVTSFIDIMELTEQHEVFVDGTLLDDFKSIIIDDNYDIKAFACILSQLVDGVWNYSNSTLVCANPAGTRDLGNFYWYGLTFGDALVDYLGSEAASKLFTRKGGLINEF